MSNVRNEQSDYVRFYLKSANKESRRVNPKNWSDDSQNFIRNRDYHGMFIEYTNGLDFYGDDKLYIDEDFETYGITSKMYLSKYVLKDVDGEVKWTIDYIGFVDYKTRSVKDGKITLNFNSNDLERIIEAYESTEFEIEKTRSVKDTEIEEMQTDLVNLKGRTLFASGALELARDVRNQSGDVVANAVTPMPYGQDIPFFNQYNAEGTSIQTDYRLVTPLNVATTEELPARVSTSDITGINDNIDYASKMFFVDSATWNNGSNRYQTTNISGTIKFKVAFHGYRGKRLDANLYKIRWDRNNQTYNIVATTTLVSRTLEDNTSYSNAVVVEYFGEFSYPNLSSDEGLLLGFYTQPSLTQIWGDQSSSRLKVYEHVITIDVDTTYRESTDLKFAFVHDVVERLLYILTGNKNKLRSFAFGRTERGYEADGDYGLIGLISGFWLRDWDSENELYKSLTISLKDIFDDLKSVFNIGIGIELLDNIQKVVLEDLDYFYQDRTFLSLGKVSDINRKTMSKDYFSTIETGYNKGGDYENALGLDEPNTKTSRTTPIDNGSSSLRKVSNIRADDTGMELTRRKPYELYKKEDTRWDLHNWFLDCKRDINGRFTQKDWFDRLDELPEGISFPEDFRSFFFTPLRIMLRHGRIIRSGLEQLINMPRKILFASSTGNSSLKMKFSSDSVAYREDGDVVIRNLLRAKILPEEITFKKSLSEEQKQLLREKTRVYYQDAYRDIPNYYFKVEFINEYDELEYGYIWEVKPLSGEFKLLKSNEKIL